MTYPAPYPIEQPPPAEKNRAPVIIVALIVLIVAAAIVIVVLLTSGPSDEQRAITACDDAVRSQLKAPSTAKFSGEHIVPTDAVGAPMIKGSVDAENGFSAMIRTGFTCYMVTNNDVMSVSQTQIDDPTDDGGN